MRSSSRIIGEWLLVGLLAGCVLYTGWHLSQHGFVDDPTETCFDQ